MNAAPVRVSFLGNRRDCFHGLPRTGAAFEMMCKSDIAVRHHDGEGWISEGVEPTFASEEVQAIGGIAPNPCSPRMSPSFESDLLASRLRGHGRRRRIRVPPPTSQRSNERFPESSSCSPSTALCGSKDRVSQPVGLAPPAYRQRRRINARSDSSSYGAPIVGRTDRPRTGSYDLAPPLKSS